MQVQSPLPPQIGAEIYQNGERRLSLYGPESEVRTEIQFYAQLYSQTGPVKVIYLNNIKDAPIMKSWIDFLGQLS